MIAQIEMAEIAEIAAALIQCADRDSFAALVVSLVDKDSEGAKRVAIAILPGLRAIHGELLNVDFGFPHDEPERGEFFDILIGLLQPLLEGVAKVRFVRHEELDRLIVLPVEPDDGLASSFSHVGSSSMPESVLLSA